MEAIETTADESPTTAAVVPLRADVIVAPAATPGRVVEAMEAYRETCRVLLDRTDYQQIGRKEFRKKSGWRKLAVAYNVSAELVSRDYERDERNRIIRAEIVVRAIAPNGRTMDGLGACDISERCCEAGTCTNTYNSHKHCASDCDGFVHFSKPSHDLPATAHTRATNRACADLFGLGEVSAEEVSERDAQHYEPPAPPPPRTEGWATAEEEAEAHRKLHERIKALPADAPERLAARQVREEHGWPISLERFKLLAEAVENATPPTPSAPEAAPDGPTSSESPPEATTGVPRADAPMLALCVACQEEGSASDMQRWDGDGQLYHPMCVPF